MTSVLRVGVLSVVVGVVVGLLLLLLGAILSAVPTPITIPVGAFLAVWCWIFGMLAGVWYFFTHASF